MPYSPSPGVVQNPAAGLKEKGQAGGMEKDRIPVGNFAPTG
jgi:hypothetical protein